ncbi:MAG: DUF2007 domain-containing protein [Thermoanaerobaculaceae bacterium]|nr:DUF2007 domain-containing protein [Thermoanaerobaculaceae bacterium]
MPWCPECRAEYRDGFVRCSECQVDLVAVLPEDGDRDDQEWVEVGAFPTLEAAELAQGYLQGAGIEAELRDPDPGHHEILPASGWVALAVAPDSVAVARQLLDEAEKGQAAVSESEPSAS